MLLCSVNKLLSTNWYISETPEARNSQLERNLTKFGVYLNFSGKWKERKSEQ
jgi:hypothetical protein